MKIYKYLTLVVLISFFGCSDFLEENIDAQILAGSPAILTEDGLTQALTGAYQPLTSTWTTGFNTAALKALLMGSDDLTTHPASNKADFREFDQFVVTNVNGRLSPLWNGVYKSIQGANNIINNYEEATGLQENINQIAGEAFFLRAYGYYWMVRLHGNIPLVLNSEVFSDDILNISLSTPEQVYEQIVSDLTMAESLLKNSRPAPGRPNKGVVKAVLAEVYLTMAGWPLNQTDKYALAASKAKEVIDNKDTYGFKLLDSFADIWVTANAGSSEEIFSIMHCSSCAWYSSNAIYGSSARPSEEGGWDDYFPEINFYNNFPNGVRKDETFYTVFEDAGNILWQNSITKHPYYKKFRGMSNSWLSDDSLKLMRMAQVYLIFAEAQIMATGNNSDSDALEALNKIVRRAAGLPLNVASATVDFTSATQQDIVQERAWEFAGEHIRWFDLTRLQLVETVNTNKHVDDLTPQGLTSEDYYLPIPASENL